MRLELPYLDHPLTLDIPDRNLLGILEPNDIDVVGNSKDILLNSLEHSIGYFNNRPQNLHDFLNGARTVLIIINDATRPSPTEAMLESLLPTFNRAKIALSNIFILVACGAHRAPYEYEYKQILGNLYNSLRTRCFHHDSNNEAEMVDLGVTQKGTPVCLNRMLFQVDRIIATGSVEPHYFAGFTGGRKALFPGVAGFRTIEANHKLALSPKAQALLLDGNPVHEDMLDALSFLKVPVFAFMTVLNKEQKIISAVSGDIVDSFNLAVEDAIRVFCVPIRTKADIVLAIAKPPMDINLYQSQKAIDNGALGLKDGGILILVSSCREGFGDESYVTVLTQAKCPLDVIDIIRSEFKLGYHKAAKMAEVLARATVQAVTELPAQRLLNMFIEPAISPQIALDLALLNMRTNTGAEPKILVLLDACVTVPQIETKQ